MWCVYHYCIHLHDQRETSWCAYHYRTHLHDQQKTWGCAYHYITHLHDRPWVQQRRKLGVRYHRSHLGHQWHKWQGQWGWRWNTYNRDDTRSKQVKGSKERYLLGQNTTCRFSTWSPLSSYKTTLKQQLNGEIRLKMRWRANPLIFGGGGTDTHQSWVEFSKLTSSC